MSSYSPAASKELRRVPCQERGERRVTALLDATEAVIAKSGYDAATMSAIAERAEASIGSLYQFFPNKPAVVRALRIRYVKSIEELWAPLETAAKALNLPDIVEHLIDSTIRFVDDHPAFLLLLDAPATTRIPTETRTPIRERVARILLAHQPDIPKAKVMRLAAVTLQLMKTMNQLYAEASAREKREVVQEFKAVLRSYLTDRLSSAGSGARS